MTDALSHPESVTFHPDKFAFDKASANSSKANFTGATLVTLLYISMAMNLKRLCQKLQVSGIFHLGQNFMKTTPSSTIKSQRPRLLTSSMASIIVILDPSAQNLIHRSYTQYELPISLDEILEKFRKLIKINPHPVIHDDENGVNYVYIRQSNEGIYLLIITYYEHVNAMVLVTFLYKLMDILLSYFNVKILNKDLIVDNFNLIYELFDEIMDYGIPQLTDISILKDVIKLEVSKNEIGPEDDEMKDSGPEVSLSTKFKSKKVRKEIEEVQESVQGFINSSVLRSSTQAISWRPKGIFYKKNEFFVDIFERNELVVDLNNKIVKHVIHGEFQIKCYLSGMPLLKIGLNKLTDQDPEFLSNVKLHQCVQLEEFHKNKVIQFIPPDGKFQLCSYTLNLKALPVVQILTHQFMQNDDLLRFKITLRTNYRMNLTISKMLVKIPIDLDRYDIDFKTNPKFKTGIGKVLYKFDENAVIWDIEQISGDRTVTMMSQFQLKSDKPMETTELGMDPPPKESKPRFAKIQKQIESETIFDEEHQKTKNIEIQFDLPDYTVSNLRVDYLKITEDQLEFTSFPWVRYKSLNDDDYVYRI